MLASRLRCAPDMLLIELGFMAIVLFVVAALLATVAVAARSAGRNPAADVVRVGLVLATWLVLTGGAAAAGLLRVDHGPFRVLPLVVVAIAGPLLAMRGPIGRALVAATPRAVVVAVQVFRIPVELVLWRLLVAGVVPVQMTFEGRNLDVLTGLTAIPVAIVAWGAQRRGWRLALAWHTAGIALLINIVSIAIRSVPGPLRTYAAEPANTIIGHAPFIWLPAFLVPVALLGHVVGIRQAVAARRAA